MSEPCHGIVFRDVSEQLYTKDFIAALRAELRLLASDPDNKELLLSALLRAGELECWLADIGHLMLIPVTNVLARAMTGRALTPAVAAIQEKYLAELKLPQTFEVSRPEGFAFYGLHPLDYCDALAAADFGDGPVMVIGIRSIGTTLSAVVAGSLHQRFGKSKNVVRMTVRPYGHPYDRQCHFPDHYAEIIRQLKATAQFLIVDEGPGLSGSSFLSVGEALVVLGVPAANILFLGSRQVDAATLVTSNARERWQRFRFLVTPRNHIVPEASAQQLHAGLWRTSAFTHESEWPGIWTAMSPPQYTSADKKCLFDYHGLGRYGDAVRGRTNRLADADYVLPASKAANGYSRSAVPCGRRLKRSDATPELLDHMAGYLAFRADNLSVDEDVIDHEEIEQMAIFNLRQAIGKEYGEEFFLSAGRACVTDSCMAPYYWLREDISGRILKLEASTHGDDHFFPGAIDIAWDLAGVITEWQLDPAATDRFLQRYTALTGDDVTPRLRNYQLAYCAFRNAYCRMAASAMSQTDSKEASRLAREAARYADMLRKFCASETVAVAAT